MRSYSGRMLGHYRIYSSLGRGASGEVFRAKDIEARRPVAIKILRPEPYGGKDRDASRQRLMQEAQIAQLLHHPNIVSVHGFHLLPEVVPDEVDILGYIVMDLVPGRSLARHFQLREPVGLGFALQVMAGTLAALHHAHAQGVVHHDVKPGNILLSATGKVKLSDFGVAHAAGMAIDDNGVPFGTLSYVAPERLRHRPTDHRGDIFSAGAVFYEALTGKRAFPGYAASTVRRILNDHPVRPSVRQPDIPEALDAVIAQALAKAPEDRFPTVAAFVDAIEAVVGSSRWAAAVAGADPTSGVAAPLWNTLRTQPEAPLQGDGEDAPELTTAPLQRVLEEVGLGHDVRPEPPQMPVLVRGSTRTRAGALVAVALALTVLVGVVVTHRESGGEGEGVPNRVNQPAVSTMASVQTQIPMGEAAVAPSEPLRAASVPVSLPPALPPVPLATSSGLAPTVPAAFVVPTDPQRSLLRAASPPPSKAPDPTPVMVASPSLSASVVAPAIPESGFGARSSEVVPVAPIPGEAVSQEPPPDEEPLYMPGRKPSAPRRVVHVKLAIKPTPPTLPTTIPSPSVESVRPPPPLPVP